MNIPSIRPILRAMFIAALVMSTLSGFAWAARTWPAFKDTATTVAIGLLVTISAVGLLTALVLRATSTDQTTSGTSRSRRPDRSVMADRAPHPGDHR